jgi:glycosyltransferase involved in cell wall biosynthesis
VTFPGVSVVLPILNEERYLKHAIEAILAQKYPGEIEVILAIGPSKDATHQIAETLRNHDSRVVLVDMPKFRIRTSKTLLRFLKKLEL